MGEIIENRKVKQRKRGLLISGNRVSGVRRDIERLDMDDTYIIT